MSHLEYASNKEIVKYVKQARIFAIMNLNSLRLFILISYLALVGRIEKVS